MIPHLEKNGGREIQFALAGRIEAIIDARLMAMGNLRGAHPPGGFSNGVLYDYAGAFGGAGDCILDLDDL